MSETCKWLHEQLEQLPLISYPFDLNDLPRSGIYFFYEEGETWGHGGQRPRIVRVGSHRGGTFRGRISEHFLLNESKMDFDASQMPPRDRSIFRKNIGRAVLNMAGDEYLDVWNIDFMPREKRDKYGHLRDIDREKTAERRVTRILRETFSFKYVLVPDQDDRLGKKGLERALIGTFAGCHLCRPSPRWLGNYSPVDKIRDSGLWQVQHVKHPPLTASQKEAVLDAIQSTQAWLTAQALGSVSKGTRREHSNPPFAHS